MGKKIINLLIVFYILLVIPNSRAQTNNWSKLDMVKNSAAIYGGLEYGIVYGFQYARIYKSKSIVWVPNLDLSLPLGKTFLDDYQIKLGTDAKLLQYEHWIASGGISIVNRQNKNPFVKMQALGSEVEFEMGYYRSRWFANINFSLQNTVFTHLKHSEAYKDNYAGVKDGWYQNTANNQKLGLNTGYSFKKNDITLSSGLVKTDWFKGIPNLPFYAKIGLNHRF